MPRSISARGRRLCRSADRPAQRLKCGPAVQVPSPRGSSGQGVLLSAFVYIITIERKHAHLANVEPCASKHAESHSGIQNKDILEPGGRLDLDEPPTAAGQPFEHVDADRNALVHKGRLEQRDHVPRFYQPTGIGKGVHCMAVVVRDEVAVGVAPACHRAHVMPGREKRPERVPGLGRKMLDIRAVPEVQVALSPGRSAIWRGRVIESRSEAHVSRLSFAGITSPFPEVVGENAA